MVHIKKKILKKIETHSKKKRGSQPRGRDRVLQICVPVEGSESCYKSMGGEVWAAHKKGLTCRGGKITCPRK